MANATTKTVLSFCVTVESRLPDLTIKDGQLIFIKDKHKIALDLGGKRTFYNQIEELATEDDRKTLVDPVVGSYYFVLETAVFWTFQDSWIQITTPPKEVVFIGTELPELGFNKTLYVDAKNKEISIWDDDTSKYVVVSDKTLELTADDVNALFNKKY